MILHVFRYDKLVTMISMRIRIMEPERSMISTSHKNVAAMQGASVVLWGAVSRLDVAPSLGKVCQHARHVIQAVCEF